MKRSMDGPSQSQIILAGPRGTALVLPLPALFGASENWLPAASDPSSFCADCDDGSVLYLSDLVLVHVEGDHRFCPHVDDLRSRASH